MSKESIQKQILAKIDRAKDYKDTKIKPKDKERLQRYRSDKDLYAQKLPNLTEYSFTDTSVMSAVERMTAQIIKMLFGNKDIGSIKGRNADDDKNGETMQELCNWQVEFANAGYQKFYWAVKECLYQLYSVVMVTQKREYEEVEEDKQIPIEAADEFQAQCEANGVQILDDPAPVEGMMVDPQTGQQIPCYNVKIKYTKLTKNYPLIENVPSEELIWTPGAKTLKESELVGRRKQVTIDYLVRNIKKKQADGTITGMYDKKAVMELATSGSSSTSDDMLDTARNNGANDDDTHDIDDPNRKVWITECFAKVDFDGKHMLDDCIITVVEEGNVFIRYEKNEDGFPFCVLSPVFDPYCIVPSVSGIDSLGQWQDLLTAIIRLTVQNLAVNNNPQQLCNSSAFVDFNQVLDGDQYIEINGLPSEAMQPTAEVPLAPYTLQLIEMVKGWGEEASNINRYNQGMDSQSLNKTATGITALINQGSQAMELIMRNIAETGLKDLFMRMVFLNQKYIDHDQVVRLTNKDITVNKDNLKGDFDYIVNAGMGAGAKETDVANITNLIAQMPTLIQGGIATIKNAYNAEKKYLELIGIRNVDDYLTDPEQQPPQPPQEEDKDNITANIQDAPIFIQAQFWAKKGFESTPEMFIEQMKLVAQLKAMEAQIKNEADLQKTVVQAEIKDHQTDKQHAHNMQSAHMNNTAKERGMMLNGQIAEARSQSDSQRLPNSNSGGNQSRPVQNVV
jgi:hypothetical protein